MKDLIIRCTLMCDEKQLKEEYKRIRSQMGSGLIVLPWYDEVIINETDDEIVLNETNDEERRIDKICYREEECECRDCGECEYNERDDKYDF